MGNTAPSLACFSGACTAADGTAQYEVSDGRSVVPAGAEVLSVSVEIAGANRKAVEVPLNRALWTTPIAVFKHALVQAVKEGNATEELLGPRASDPTGRLPGIKPTLGPPTPVLTTTTSSSMSSGSAVHVVVVACARCGQPRGCPCGWRSTHAIHPSHELLSLAQLLPRILPGVPVGGELVAMRSVHVKLVELDRAPVVWLEATVVRYTIVDPIVERLRAVFKVEIQFGDHKWSVSRRFQEFAALHDALRKKAGALSISMLPEFPPTTWFSRLDVDFLHLRRAALDRYLRGLLFIDCIRDSVALLSFLGAIATNQETLLLPVPDSRRPLEVMHLRILQYYVSAGDVLLFQSHGVVSSLQRSLTGSQWDHVGVVVPRASDDPTKGFLLLEATGDGVTALSLTSRLYAYSAFHTNRIVLRQLHTPLLSAAVRRELLQRFTTQVKGRPYGLGLNKMLRVDDPVHHCDSGKCDYFCSELVADAYKALGLIDQTILPSNFWPSSFALGAFVDAEIGRHGATLGGAIAIDCHVLEVALSKRMATSPSI